MTREAPLILFVAYPGTGLLGLVLCWVPWIGILLAGVGIVLSGIAIPQGKKKGAGNGLAIAGLGGRFKTRLTLTTPDGIGSTC